MIVKLKISEADWQQTVIELAKLSGWSVAHFRSVRVQRKDGSVYYQTPVQADGSGFVDLILAKEGHSVVFAELKVGRNKPSPEQKAWLELLASCPNSQVFLWYPEDFEDVKWILLGGQNNETGGINHGR
uniref:VRR-NUC domain-containing protein n=1 Tax=viral metagenome TaxID=1070528 RepID=A0A6M3KED2_9ZZZZ